MTPVPRSDILTGRRSGSEHRVTVRRRHLGSDVSVSDGPEQPSLRRPSREGRLLEPANVVPRATAPRACGGFTFIELVITVAIVGILAAGLVPLTEISARRAKEAELRAGLREIRTALNAYKKAVEEGRIMRKVDESGYPPSLDVLVDGVTDAKSTASRRIYFLRRLPRDPLAPDNRIPAALTWGLRSYESPPDAPQPGRDVFDVYSRSTGMGLNGVPYAKW